MSAICYSSRYLFLFAADIKLFATVAWESHLRDLLIAQRPIEALTLRPTPTFWPDIITTAFQQRSGSAPKAYMRIYPPNEPPIIVTFFVTHNSKASFMAFMLFSRVNASVSLDPCPGRSMRILLNPFSFRLRACGMNIFRQDPAPWIKIISFELFYPTI